MLAHHLHLQAQEIIARDPEIGQMVSEVSPDSLKYDISTLVAFGTRSTLSTQTNIKRGIGAAKKWMLDKFLQFAKQSNGRLTAFIDTITLHADRQRIDTTVLLGNVVATLKGTDPLDDKHFPISSFFI